MISPNHLAEIVIKVITGRESRNCGIVYINGKYIRIKGDLSFPLDLDHWRGYIDTESDCFKNSKDILHYFVNRNALTHLTLDADILQVLKNYIIDELNGTYNEINLHQRLYLDYTNKFVLINFRRSIVACDAFKSVTCKHLRSGRKQSCMKHFTLEVDNDKVSEVTNLRLYFLRKVSLNLLKCQDFDAHCDDNISNNYVFTTKSENNIDKSSSPYLCGVILNGNKKKECILSQEMYIQKKVEKIKKLNYLKHFYSNIDANIVEKNVETIAKASVVYELLSVKHSSPVIIEKSDDKEICIKEAAFILYNNVRITAILNKYTRLVFDEDYPQLDPIESVVALYELVDDESWSLIYNYIIKYPDVLEAVVKVEPKLEINIHLLWAFVSCLCHDFSKYYRKHKIIMVYKDGNDLVRVTTRERLHLLKALQTVLINSLSLLDIEELNYM
ncbi:PREDICTED: uncharacterized protein LOC105368868 [Ceratosolen solmsi marchali]|uniref:Uncharacterized protein LOC105368868 n=1 Tax=Ceratosolen solmsi marchali TaxID=326594 RepID=A0AAJ6YXU9_9HYME|nr:PREDICTED: uncharacterized protein LOC105368868 [Ceratosolen solmsi marchali]